MDPISLYCEYIHCCGRNVLRLGEVETKEMAERWIQGQIMNKKRPKLPENDLIRTCPVIHCPAKLQFPRYYYGSE